MSGADRLIAISQKLASLTAKRDGSSLFSAASRSGKRASAAPGGPESRRSGLDPAKPKSYMLEMLPYPSGEPHVGHLKNDAIGDEAERRRLWAFADRVFAPYATYRRDAAKANRTIPIIQLAARESEAVASPCSGPRSYGSKKQPS